MFETEGLTGIDTYLALRRGAKFDGRLGALTERRWAHGWCSTWFGFGGRVLLHALHTGLVPPHHWADLARAAHLGWSSDLYLGVAGLAGCLAVIGAKDPVRARPVVTQVRRRCERHLSRLWQRHDEGHSVFLGFGHGLMGSLLAFEQCSALLGESDTGHTRHWRHRVIDFVGSRAQTHQGRPCWHAGSRPTEGAAPPNGLCHGATGICFSAIYGFRYSGDDAYAPLINHSLAGVPMLGGDVTFCCGVLGRANVLFDAFLLSDEPEALAAAKQHVAAVSPAAFWSSEGWGYGRGGLRLTEWRLHDPTAELPGYPLEVHPLRPNGS